MVQWRRGPGAPVGELGAGASGPVTARAALTVADVMTAPVVAVTPAAAVGAARRVMRREQIRHLPVVVDGLLVGVVSEHDLLGAEGDAVPVADVMTRPVFVLAPETPLRAAARTLRQRRLGAMPVLRGRELVGMVSIVDVMRALEERLRVDPHDRSC